MGSLETDGLSGIRNGISRIIFIVAGALHVRAGSVFLVVANQEREKLGLENPVVHDTDMAIRTAIGAIRELIRQEQK